MRFFLCVCLTASLWGGCAVTQTGPVKQIDVRVKPKVVSYGVAAMVTAKPVNGAKLRWLKGTVEFPSFDNIPDVKLKYDKNTQTWKRKFPSVPSFLQIKPGMYTVKVWGKGHQGGRYEGSTKVEFK